MKSSRVSIPAEDSFHPSSYFQEKYNLGSERLSVLALAGTIVRKKESEDSRTWLYSLRSVDHYDKNLRTYRKKRTKKPAESKLTEKPAEAVFSKEEVSALVGAKLPKNGLGKKKPKKKSNAIAVVATPLVHKRLVEFDAWMAAGIEANYLSARGVHMIYKDRR